MADSTEIIDAPSYAAVGTVQRKRCNDPLLATRPGRIELDLRRRMVTNPASTYLSAPAAAGLVLRRFTISPSVRLRSPR
jgi:hypothetical protein